MNEIPKELVTEMQLLVNKNIEMPVNNGIYVDKTEKYEDESITVTTLKFNIGVAHVVLNGIDFQADSILVNNQGSVALYNGEEELCSVNTTKRFIKVEPQGNDVFTYNMSFVDFEQYQLDIAANQISIEQLPEFPMYSEYIEYDEDDYDKFIKAGVKVRFSVLDTEQYSLIQKYYPRDTSMGYINQELAGFIEILYNSSYMECFKWKGLKYNVNDPEQTHSEEPIYVEFDIVDQLYYNKDICKHGILCKYPDAEDHYEFFSYEDIILEPENIKGIF